MKFKDLDEAALSALIARIEQASENDFALCSEDLKLLLSAIQTLAMLQEKINDQDITLTKLRKLLGMIKSSESRGGKGGAGSNPKGESKGNGSNKGGKGNKGNNSRGKGNNLPVEHHGMQGFKKGDECPKCPTVKKGRLYKYQPLEFVRISAHAPYEGKKHVAERLRCNLCQAIFVAEVPKSLTEDGPMNQMYGYSARSAMAMAKFFSGLGYHHQEITSFFSDLSISASTIFDQVEALSEDVTPAYREIIKLAGNAELLLADDTPHRILSQAPQMRPNRTGKGERLRTGVYCSGLVAYYDHHEIAVYEISLGHSGELMDSVLEKRDPSLPAPKIMSDALSANKVTVCETQTGNCNSHSRRKFVEAESAFPEECGNFLDEYGTVWGNEKKIKELNLTPEQRLEYHKKHSLPVMNGLKDWCEEQKAKEDFEQHSCLGKAIAYFLNHFTCLIAFCTILGMPIDNNRMEETLKLIIRGRKSYMFFKTVAGATVANILTTLIMTAYRAKENPFEYLTALQKYQSDLKARPGLWMPWNYRRRIEQLLQEKMAKAA